MFFHVFILFFKNTNTIDISAFADGMPIEIQFKLVTNMNNSSYPLPLELHETIFNSYLYDNYC
jgi:hypothetical protein